jgi:hypothetical protein
VLRDELGLDPGPELLALERAVLQRDPELSARERRTAPSSLCPYRGLRVFEREDADGFFGRDEEVQSCLRVLRDSPSSRSSDRPAAARARSCGPGSCPTLESPGHSVPIVLPGTTPTQPLVTRHRLQGRARALVVDQLEELFTAGPRSAGRPRLPGAARGARRQRRPSRW